MPRWPFSWVKRDYRAIIYITPGMEWVNTFSSPKMDIPALNQAAFLAIPQATAGSSSLYIQSRSHLVFEAGDFNWNGYRSLWY